MQSVLFGATALLGAYCISAAEAQQRGGISQGERQQQISKLIEDMNGPDVAARIAAFETALSSRDRTLRTVALEQGLNSTDQVLREQSLREAIAQRSSIMVSFEPANPNNPAEVAAANAAGGFLEIYIFNFNNETGDFAAASPFSRFQEERGSRIYESMSGKLAGDRLTFALSLQPSGGLVTRPRWRFPDERSGPGPVVASCNGGFSLAGGGKLDGTLNCRSEGGAPLTFKGTIRVLN